MCVSAYMCVWYRGQEGAADGGGRREVHTTTSIRWEEERGQAGGRDEEQGEWVAIPVIPVEGYNTVHNNTIQDNIEITDMYICERNRNGNLSLFIFLSFFYFNFYSFLFLPYDLRFRYCVILYCMTLNRAWISRSIWGSWMLGSIRWVEVEWEQVQEQARRVERREGEGQAKAATRLACRMLFVCWPDKDINIWFHLEDGNGLAI